MTRPTVLAVAFALAGPAPAADPPLKSGLDRGEVATTFKPLVVYGPQAGQHFCLVCKHGNFPTAMIFARDVGDELGALVRRLDALSQERYGDCLFGGYVLFCNDAPGLHDRIRGFGRQQGLRKIDLAVDMPAGPERYHINPDADVTVILTRLQRAQFTYAFRKGELTPAASDQIMADVAKILPPKRNLGR
jgi:hypothetical protein